MNPLPPSVPYDLRTGSATQLCQLHHMESHATIESVVLCLGQRKKRDLASHKNIGAQVSQALSAATQCPVMRLRLMQVLPEIYAPNGAATNRMVWVPSTTSRSASPRNASRPRGYMAQAIKWSQVSILRLGHDIQTNGLSATRK